MSELKSFEKLLLQAVGSIAGEIRNLSSTFKDFNSNLEAINDANDKFTDILERFKYSVDRRLEALQEVWIENFNKFSAYQNRNIEIINEKLLKKLKQKNVKKKKALHKKQIKKLKRKPGRPRKNEGVKK